MPISEVEFDPQSRDFYVLLRCLKELFITPEYNIEVFDILEESILKDKKLTGRKGMDLWQIFVLAQVRLGLNLSYDRLHTMVNHDHLLRQVMGIASDSGYPKIEYSYQRILHNVSLPGDETIKQINHVIVDMGHDVFKKKEMEALRLKTDSFLSKATFTFLQTITFLFMGLHSQMFGCNRVFYPVIPTNQRLEKA